MTLPLPAAANPFKISLRGIVLEDAQVGVNLASTIVVADVGKALTWDSSAANQMKLAGAADKVCARLQTVENRTDIGQVVGAVALQFIDQLPIATGATFALGDTAVGSATAPGQVAPAAEGDGSNVVVEINTTAGYVVVAKI